jgi:hypothetical protein
MRARARYHHCCWARLPSFWQNQFDFLNEISKTDWLWRGGYLVSGNNAGSSPGLPVAFCAMRAMETKS